MLTPAVLHALEYHAAPRAKPVAKPQAVPPEPVQAASGPQSRPGIQKIRQEDLEALGIQRPILPPSADPASLSEGERFDSYLRTLETVRGMRSHSLDLFE